MFIQVNTQDKKELIVNQSEVMCLSCEENSLGIKDMKKCFIYLINSSYNITYEEYERLKKVFLG